MSRSFLPYGCQSIDDDDVRAVAEALTSNFLTTGPLVEAYESAFCQATGSAQAVSSNSGTAALHLAALAVGLGAGNSAIVPSLTFLATANAVRMTGADVIFADVDPNTGLITPSTLKAALMHARNSGARIEAVFPVHLNGNVCEMAELAEVAGRIPLIEDACHALGGTDIGACHHSFAACFSTHAVKAIATAEGGMTTTADPCSSDRMRTLRSHGMSRAAERFESIDLAFDDGNTNPWHYEMSHLGWNYRLPDVLCGLGLSQLTKLARFTSRRREIAEVYDRLLAPLAPLITPVPRGARHALHLYALLVDFAGLGLSRRVVMEKLKAEGIGTQVHYIPVHLQPYYRNLYGNIRLPGAERYFERCLSIPFYPGLGTPDLARVSDALARLSVLTS